MLLIDGLIDMHDKVIYKTPGDEFSGKITPEGTISYYDPKKSELVYFKYPTRFTAYVDKESKMGKMGLDNLFVQSEDGTFTTFSTLRNKLFEKYKITPNFESYNNDSGIESDVSLFSDDDSEEPHKKIKT